MRSYNTLFSLNDILCNMLLGFICLFVFAILMIAEHKEKQTESPEMHAAYVIVVTWPSESPDDVDTYVSDPLGNIVCFNRREEGLMHLDRDDLGHRNDTIIGPDGQLIFNENRETVIIRGFVVGEYVVNVHLYKREPTYDKPIPVTVTLYRVSPYSLVTTQTVILNYTGDEYTAFRFTIANDGSVTGINQLQRRFINITPENQ